VWAKAAAGQTEITCPGVRDDLPEARAGD